MEDKKEEDKKERNTAKSSAPCAKRNQPDIFRLTIMRRSRSARFWVRVFQQQARSVSTAQKLAAYSSANRDKFNNPKGHALASKSSVFLGDGFAANGQVRFHGVEIGDQII